MVSDINFKEILKFHKKKGALATIILTNVSDPTHFGIAVLNEKQEITEYREKPSPNEVFSNIANTGTYILEPEIFEFFDGLEGQVDFSKDIFPQLIEKKAGIYGYTFNGYWNDVGRPETYLKATYDLLNQKIKQNIYSKTLKQKAGRLGKIWTGNNVFLGSRVRIEGPVVIGTNCIIEEGCKLSKGTVIGNGAYIGRNTIINGSVILKNTKVKKNSFINKSIIDSNAR